jgi:pseudouridine kinase
MDEGYALVIGSAGIDIKGLAIDALKSGTPVPGRVRNSVGGVARNIAENLARLEVPVVLLSAVGDDTQGLRVLDECKAAGINCDHVQIASNSRTGTFMAFFKENGELENAITDFDVMMALDGDYLERHEDLFAGADIVIIDATLTTGALYTLFRLTEKYQVRVCADPTTPALAGKLCPYIDGMYLIVPNAAETASLCGLTHSAHDRDSATSAARELVAMGAQIAVVTMGEQGLAYADGSGGGFIRGMKTRVVDSTGAGDALTGAVIFGLLNDVELDEAMRLGITAAHLTLQSRETVLPALTQELLYDKLMV